MAVSGARRQTAGSERATRARSPLLVDRISDIAELLALESPPSLRAGVAEEMYRAADGLRFEYAAKLRDEIKELRRELMALAAPSA